MQELRRAQPNISLAWIANQMPIKLDADREHYLEALPPRGLGLALAADAIMPMSGNGMVRACSCPASDKLAGRQDKEHAMAATAQSAIAVIGMHSAEADVRPPKRKSGFRPKPTFLSAIM